MTQSQQTIEELYDCYAKTAANIISYYENNEKKKKLKELRDIVENNCIQDEKLKLIENVKTGLLNVYCDEDEEQEADIEFVMRQYKEDTSAINIDVSNEPKLLEFDKQVEALNGNIDNEKNDEDTELQLTGGCINVIDPISRKRIVDPVKNTLCGHTYDKESITQILQLNKKTRCPVIGCQSKEFVTLANLRTDIVTKTYLEKNPS